jgi:sigma-B regulation protein RsbU (phosphoserine phosphatase)
MSEVVATESNINKSDTIKRTILYVDDEESNLRIFKMAFKRQYNVLTALGGMEALEVLRNNHVELIITDQKMPEMTGTELLERVQPEFPDVIRIILTGFADIEAIIKAVNRCGIYKYITKPWDKGEMLLTIDKALETYQLKQEKTSLVEELEDMNANLEKMVEERTRELEEANKKMMDSIHYAYTIQTSMLPKIEVLKETFEDCFIFFRPLHIVSGDFYWNRRVTDKNQDLSIIASIDCTGHGVPGALMGMLGESILKHIVSDKNIFSPDGIINELNLEVDELLNQHNEEDIHHGMDISIVVVDHKNNSLSFSGAKQDFVYVKNGELEVIKGERISIGEKIPDQIAVNHTMVIDTPITFYLFSDGYRDQFGGPDFRKFGPNQLRNLLFDIHSKPMIEQKEIIEKTLNEWVGDEIMIDDVLLMGFKVLPQ